ncbi:Secretion system apparatus protein B [Yersinia intermedia]|jgi:hypothetical protein|uniref:Secretion system apparatus protein B n=1 Tax=Yersinia intermedia TaxID=631 RepID=A0A0T9M2H0_YERIN|nr:hypothetical protein [Yersinia intermedia]AJJ17313.1 hypothetical protein CH53_1435 [Yersinia intermedia]MDA5481196.1 hypothetical protein [Yersinia intermedia]MDA5493908.1 hypothetical protein [Yersinia intermedia]MDA5511020.1 hypothetical protein [Yersinia intermedia]MDN0115073.1 hypothetical protein [Yersinia intermedia]
MLDMLKRQPLVSDIDLSDINIIQFILNGIPAKAMDYHHSICIGVFFIERKMISNSVIQYITLMLVALENTQDFALQFNDGNWWLWGRYTLDNSEIIGSENQELSMKLEQIHAVIQHLSGLVATLSPSQSNALTKQKKHISKAIP